MIIITCSNLLAQDDMVNSGNLRMHTNSQMGIFGDFTNNGTCNSNIGEVHIVGTSLQNINGSNTIQFENLTLNNANNAKLDNELQISDELTFTAGIINSDRSDNTTEFVHFLAGSSHTGASATSCVDGVVRKTGNTAFTFPLGDVGLYRYVAISAPGNATDHFTAYYNFEDPVDGGYSDLSFDPTINHVSDCEYWILDRTNGTSNVTVTLSYDNLGSNGCSGVVNQADLLVARWDGSTWKDHGNSATSGTAMAGDVTTSGNVSSFSPFTLASTTNVNPLPVELTVFDVVKAPREEALIHWTTASEINNDFFIVEKTRDFSLWEKVAKVDGQGNSAIENNYEVYDTKPYSGQSYYRLKQVDYDGAVQYSEIRSIYFEGNSEIAFNIYPNPSDGIVNILFEEEGRFDLVLTNSVGQIVRTEIIPSSENYQHIMDVRHLSAGVYYLTLSQNDSPTDTYKIVIR